jgi:hypothetical protein
MAIYNESYMIVMLHGNTTFHLTFIKPFYKINELIKAKSFKLERNNEDVYKDTIIVNTIERVTGRGVYRQWETRP